MGEEETIDAKGCENQPKPLEVAGENDDAEVARKRHSSGPSERIHPQAIFLYLFSILTVSLVSGLVFGWPSLRRQLIQVDGSELDEKRLGIVITVGTWSTQSSRLFWGIARDRYFGTRTTACFSIFLAAVGCLGVGLSSSQSAVALSVSMFFVGLGSGAQLCFQPVACIFPKNVEGTVLASLAGAFQVSGLVFVALTAITSDRMAAFVSFSMLLIVLCLVSFLILPRHQFVLKEEEKGIAEGRNDQEGEQSGDDLQGLIAETTRAKDGNTVQHDVEAHDQRDVSAEQIKPDKPSAMNQLWNAEYIALVVWFSLCLVPLQYYVATIGYQLERKGDDDGRYARLFSILYAAVAGVSPFLGKFADTAGLGASHALGTVLTGASFFFLASYRISLPMHAVGMAVYGLGRMMVFSIYYTNVAKRFGYGNYGVLTGLGLLLSGLAMLLQYPLITLASDGRDSEVNVGCGVVVLCLLPYCVWLGVRERTMKSAQSG